MEYLESLKHELICEYNAEDQPKDILLVVKDQLDYLEDCVDSIYKNTQNFRLFIWDNASNEDCRSYIDNLSSKPEVFVNRSHDNQGFIKPNNELASKGDSPYIILLNSDTEVYSGWDRALLGYLQEHNNTAIVGYMGGVLNERGENCGITFGEKIDYVMGWCLALSRKTYEEHGLFNDNLSFAYFEDSDLSLRMKDIGMDVYALHLEYVWHAGNATVSQVQYEMDLSQSFRENQLYFQQRWADYLLGSRVLLEKNRLCI